MNRRTGGLTALVMAFIWSSIAYGSGSYVANPFKKKAAGAQASPTPSPSPTPSSASSASVKGAQMGKGKK